MLQNFTSLIYWSKWRSSEKKEEWLLDNVSSKPILHLSRQSLCHVLKSASSFSVQTPYTEFHIHQQHLNTISIYRIPCLLTPSLYSDTIYQVSCLWTSKHHISNFEHKNTIYRIPHLVSRSRHHISNSMSFNSTLPQKENRYKNMYLYLETTIFETVLPLHSCSCYRDRQRQQQWQITLALKIKCFLPWFFTEESLSLDHQSELSSFDMLPYLQQ